LAERASSFDRDDATLCSSGRAALVGVRFDPYLKAFYLHLQARHKTKLQALMAVSRKLLHAIFGIFKNGSSYDGAKLFSARGTA